MRVGRRREVGREGSGNRREGEQRWSERGRTSERWIFAFALTHEHPNPNPNATVSADHIVVRAAQRTHLAVDVHAPEVGQEDEVASVGRVNSPEI